MNKLPTLLIIVVLATLFEDCLVSGSCGIFHYSSCGIGYHCCDSGCCVDINSNLDSNIILGVGPIIGIVVGCLTFLGSCISIICCLINKKNRPGQVIQPNPNAGNMAVYPGGQNPPQYGLQSSGQPSFGQPSYGQQPYGQPHPFGTPANAMGQTTVGSNQPMKDQANPPPPPAAY